MECCSRPAPGREVGSDRPCPVGARGLLRETEALWEGVWEGARDPACMGATLASWHRWRAPELSVDARVGGRVPGFGDRPGAPEAPGGDAGGLEPQAERAVEGQPWTSGLRQECVTLWCGVCAACVFYVHCLPSRGLAPSLSAGLDGPMHLESWLRSQGKKQPGACPPSPPAFRGSVWGDADPGECSPRRVCEPGARRRPGSQGLSGVARLRSRG